MRHFRKRKPVLTELTWEEKNPTDYIYRPSKDIDLLQKMAKEMSNKSRKKTKASAERNKKA